MPIIKKGACWLLPALGLAALGLSSQFSLPDSQLQVSGLAAKSEEACILSDTGADGVVDQKVYKSYAQMFASRAKVNQAARTVDLGPAMACFAEGTPEEVMQAFLLAMASANDGAWPPPGDLGADYQLNSRWSGSQGSPRTLTWSFVPDGVSISSGAGEPVANSSLFAQMDAQFGGNRALWISKFQAVFNRWQALTGITYTRVTSGGNDWDDGAAWGTGGAAGARGDLRISMKTIDGVNGILAYNYFPANGDMVLDGGDIARWGNAGGDYINLRNVISHEHGHGMGVNHVCPVTTTKLMEPFLATNFDGPQHDDIRAAQRHYGDPYEPNDSSAAARDLGTLSPGTFTLGPTPAPNVANGSVLSIDADGENDYFRFTVGGARTATVTVTPIGLSYNDGVQNSNCTSSNVTNSLAIANLNVQLISTNGTTVLATGDVQAAGVAESVSNISLPASGNYFVRVYEGNTPAQSQLYHLTITTAIANTAPTLNPIGNKSGNELTNIGFTATATDPDAGQSLTFSLVGAPSGASINPTTGVFAFTPTEAQGPGPFTFDVRVTDNGSPNLSDSETITVTVNEVNVAPVLGAIGNKSGNEGTNITFTATATDADLPANTLTYSLVGAPAGASIGASTGIFTFVPTEAQGPGPFTFEVRVTDNGSPNLFDSETITVTVNEVNLPPVLGAIGNSTIDEETPFTFTATATDPDLPANTLTFSLIGAPAGASINPTSGVFTWTPTEAQGPGPFTFDVRVTDNGSPNLSDSETITLTVREVAKVISGNVTLLNFVGAVNGESIVFEVRQVGSTTPDEAQTVALAANGNFTFTLGNPLPAGTYDITAKGDTWLRRKIGSVVVASTGASGLNYVLTNGDCDGSNVVDSDDFDLMVASFGLSVGDGGFDSRADLDGSGTVDSDDFDILVASFGASGDQ